MISVSEVLDYFKLDKPKKTVFGNYRIQGNSLVWKTTRTESTYVLSLVELETHLSSKGVVGYTHDQARALLKERLEKKYSHARFEFKGVEVDEIARKIVVDGKTVFLGNSSILRLIGRTVAYGNEKLNRSETDIQREMIKQGFTMIPFNVFTEAKLDLNKYKLIDRGNEETFIVSVKKVDKSFHTYNVDENRHFTGASLFSVDGKVYLFDIDRNEIVHKIFNPFLASINGKPKTIKEAYEMLKPLGVKKAEKQGKKVLRQGEWFFIPTSPPKIKQLTDRQKLTILSGNFSNEEFLKTLGIKKDNKKANKLLDLIPKTGSIRAGESRPNTVQKLMKQGRETFVSGVVKHTGREHKDLNLGNKWYKVVPNTSIKNFTITGDID